MESRAVPKKRKRSIVQTVVTYNCPGGRTFARVLKEASIEDCKRVVRTKLKLADDTHLNLAQLRPGKVIDLDDDDDFAAFQAAALSEPALEVLVTISSKGLAIPISSTVTEDALEFGESASKKRKINHGDSQAHLTHGVSASIGAFSPSTPGTTLKKKKSLIGENLADPAALLEETHSEDQQDKDISLEPVLQSKPKKKKKKKKSSLVDHSIESAEVDTAAPKKKRPRTATTSVLPPDESTSSKTAHKSVSNSDEFDSIADSSIPPPISTIPTVEDILAAFNGRDPSIDDELMDVEPELTPRPVKTKRRAADMNVTLTPKSVSAPESKSKSKAGSLQLSGEMDMTMGSNNEGLITVNSEPARPPKRNAKKRSRVRDSASNSAVNNHEDDHERGALPSPIDGPTTGEQSASSKKKKLKSKSRLEKAQKLPPFSSTDSPDLLDHASRDASSPLHAYTRQPSQPCNIGAIPETPEIDASIEEDVADDVPPSATQEAEDDSDWRIRNEKQKRTMQNKRPPSSFHANHHRLSCSQSRATSPGDVPASIADHNLTPTFQLEPSKAEGPLTPHIVLPKGRRSDVSIESPDDRRSSEDEDPSGNGVVKDDGVNSHGNLRTSLLGALDLEALLRPKKSRRAALIIPSDDENAKIDDDEDSGSELARSTPSDIEKVRDKKRRRASRVSLRLYPLRRRHSSSASDDSDSPSECVIAAGGGEDYPRAMHESASPAANDSRRSDSSSGEYDIGRNGRNVNARISLSHSSTDHGALDAQIPAAQDLVRQTKSSFVQLASVPDSQISQDGGDDAFAEALDEDEQAERAVFAPQSLVEGQIGDRRVNGVARDRMGVDHPDIGIAAVEISNKDPSQDHPETPDLIEFSQGPPKATRTPQTPERSLSPIQSASPWSQPKPIARSPFSFRVPQTTASLSPPISQAQTTRHKQDQLPAVSKSPAQTDKVSAPRRGVVEVVIPSRPSSLPPVSASQPLASVPVKRGPGRPKLSEEEKARRKKERQALGRSSKAPKKKVVVDRSKSQVPKASTSKTKKAAAVASVIQGEESQQTGVPAHPLSTAWTVLQPSTPSSPFPPVESQAVDELRSSSPYIQSPRRNASFSQIDELISEPAPSPKIDLLQKETPLAQGALSPITPKAKRPSNGLLPKMIRAMSNGASRDEGMVELSLIDSTPSPVGSPRRELPAIDNIPSSTHTTGTEEGVVPPSRQPLARPSSPSASSSQISHSSLAYLDSSAIPLHLRVSSRKNLRSSLPSLKDLTVDAVRSAQPSSKQSTPGPKAASSQVLRRLTSDGDEDEEEEEETEDDDSDDNPAPSSRIPESRRAGAGIVRRAVRSLGASFFST